MDSDDGRLTRPQLLQLIADMRSDWDTVNRILNAQATAFAWCSEYEDRIREYNRETKVLKMRGRVPDGAGMSVRNAFAARRLMMGHVISTLQRYGIPTPGNCWGGVVRDDRELCCAHEQLITHLNQESNCVQC